MFLCGDSYENVYTLKAYKLSFIQGVNVFVTLATQ
jgi:hypothetical protein